MSQYKLYIGRWCPFHCGHRCIIDSMVNNGESVCIAIRKTDEIYPAKLRKEMIEACYPQQVSSGQVKVIIIPDIDMVCVGRNVGYALIQAPAEIQKISGTGIRQGTCNDIPHEVQCIIDRYEKYGE